jgi:hypothetical protein
MTRSDSSRYHSARVASGIPRTSNRLGGFRLALTLTPEAHKEGGAHDDSEMGESAARLGRSNTLGWVYFSEQTGIGTPIAGSGVDPPDRLRGARDHRGPPTRYFETTYVIGGGIQQTRPARSRKRPKEAQARESYEIVALGRRR